MIHKKKILLYEIIFFKSIIHCYRICHLFFHSKYIGFGTISKINPLSTFNIRYKLSKWDLKCFLTTIKMHDEHDLFSQKKVIVIALCNKRETIFSELLHKRCKIVNKKKTESTLKINQERLVNRAQESRRKNSHCNESRRNINSINCKGIDKGWKREEATRWELVLFIDRPILYIYVKEIWWRKKKINRERYIGKVRMNFVHCYLVTCESNIVNIPALRDQFKFFLS